MFVSTDFIEQLNKRTDLFGKRRPFRGGNPLQPQTLLVDSQQPEQLAGFFNDLLASYITFQVMTVADVSAGNQDTVRSLQKSFEQKAVIDPARTHESYQADVGRILHAGHPGEVGSGISAPVAHEGQYFRFISGRHGYLLKLKIED
jgi:hypothetical protein